MNTSEEIKEEHLKEWNDWQANLWLKLVSLRKVERNDYEAFIEFSRLFRSYYDRNGNPPSLQDILEEF